jgi:hypothetical protein
VYSCGEAKDIPNKKIAIASIKGIIDREQKKF